MKKNGRIAYNNFAYWVTKMTSKKSCWQTKELATGFLEGVRGAIPAAGLQLEVLEHIIRSWHPNPAHILDLGCGDGALGRFLLDKFPKTHVVFTDFSDPMLDATEKRLKGNLRATIIKTDFSSKAWLNDIDKWPIDIAVSGFAIHHLPDQRKKELYNEVFNMIKNGGVFLNLEHVASETPGVEAIFDSYFIDSLHMFHKIKDPAKSREEIALTYYNRPDKDENILAQVEKQCGWLRDIGFTDVDCFFKIFALAIFGGRKTSGG